MLQQILRARVRPDDHQRERQGQLRSDARPFESTHIRAVLAFVIVVPREHEDRAHEARNRRERCAEEIDEVGEEGHEIRKEPSKEKAREGDRDPPRPRHPHGRMLHFGRATDASGATVREDHTLKEAGDEHVGEQAEAAKLQAHVERQILGKHARHLIPEEVVAPETCDQEARQLERSRHHHVRLGQLRRVPHLRDDLRKHNLGGHGINEGAEATSCCRYGYIGDGEPLRVQGPCLLRTINNIIGQRDRNCPDQREDVDPDQGVVGPHPLRR
mmetsp:Transcript_84795/g.245177  ORF Transcript_84795/g.245177 Transcript_84795/m.245177 type:complete len:272 (+) Transcript_84795:222-1037(+)